MSVRVNLLPREYEARSRRRQMALLGVVVVLAWIGLLVFLLLGRLSAVDAAREDRDAAQAQVNQLQTEAAALAPFQALADELGATNELLAFAMGGEVSWAELLNDIALTTPSSTSLTSLSGNLLEDAPGTAGQGDVFVPNEADDAGVLVVNGYSIERYAPGVEAVLLRFGTVENFFQQYLTIAASDEIGDVEVTDFTAEVRLDSDALTQRYVEGLPEVGQ